MTAREIITAATCRSCGACCWSMVDQEYYADVTPEDVERLPKRFVKLHVVQSEEAIATKWQKQAAGPFKGVSACVCAALRGSLMHRVSCSVYENRPRSCRNALQPGDRSCRETRRMFKAAIADLT
jgi:Fe-S-cluster containining protein